MKNSSIRQKDGVKFVEFDHLADSNFCIHGFSTRIGGVSPPPYDTLNLGFTTSDREENLRENRDRFLSSLNLKGYPFVQKINLIHGNLVINVNHLGKKDLVDADGMVTDKPGVLLITTFADCVPIFLADPDRRAVGLLHAGWRGTLAGIARSGVRKMISDFNCRRENLLVGIGPGIGRCCFEVDRDVAEAFGAKFGQMKDLITQVANKKKWIIDLLGINERMLISEGIRKENVSKSSLCTSCQVELFFSYRRDGNKTGRMAGLITIKE